MLARAPFGALRADPFALPPALRPAPVAPQLPAEPERPPMPYRVAGSVTYDGVMKVVIARDDRVYTVEAGEMLDEDYRVESIGSGEITLLHVPLGLREQLPLIATFGAAPDETAAPARSRRSERRRR